MTGVSTLRTCVLASAGLLLFTACSEDTGGGTDSGAGTTGTQSSDSDDGLSHGGPGDGMDGPGDGESTDSSAGVTDDGVDETRGGDHATTDDDTTTGDDATTGEDTTGSEPLVPASSGELITWLEAGSYLGWTTESAVHDSAGPHFGNVRTYVNNGLLGSLEAGSDTHPINAASVKELYGDGAQVRGWSVLVKVADGVGGNTWYFLEYYDGVTYGDGVGDGSCTGCHSEGSVDYFKSLFPLQ